MAACCCLSTCGETRGSPETGGHCNHVIKPYRELYCSYGSDTRDEAMIVETLCLLNMKPKAAGLVKKISEDLSKDEWMSTQTTAYCLVAISRFIGSGSGKGIYASWSMN